MGGVGQRVWQHSGVSKALMSGFSYKKNSGSPPRLCSVFPMVGPLMQPVSCSCCKNILISEALGQVALWCLHLHPVVS